MNFRSLIILVASLGGLAGLMSAAPDYSPMKIVQTVPVVYPQETSQLGITSGEVGVAISVDETGKLTDYLVIAYSHPKFADRAVDALKRWKYEPARIAGEAHSATAELAFNFETRGPVLVNLNLTSYIEMLNAQLRPTAYSYSACRLSQLDRIPTPTKVVQPGVPLAAKELTEKLVVTVHFYIDEQGRVRLPAVDRASSQSAEAFAAEALAAVSQWQFEPPMSRGRPVLVSARQDFNFNPVQELGKR
jgi:TonB family protein